LISLAYAMGTAPGGQPSAGGGDWSFIVMMVVIFGIFYFLMIRPQQKKQKELQAMLNNLAYAVIQKSGSAAPTASTKS